MILRPTFGTKQGLIDAVNRGEVVTLSSFMLGYTHDGMYCYTGAGWYATLTTKSGKVIKVA